MTRMPASGLATKNRAPMLASAEKRRGRFAWDPVGEQRPGRPNGAQGQGDALGYRQQGPGGAQKRRTE
jgi:hypothetical protein